MANVSIARRYARALGELAEANADKVLEQLLAMAEVLGKNRELADVSQNPAYTRAERLAAVSAVASHVGVTELPAQNLLKLLVERNRLSSLTDIVRLFREMSDAKAGRTRGKVVSAAPLAADALEKLSLCLQKLAKKQVVLESKVDPSLLGGATAQIGSVVYDGSTRSQLDQLRRELLAR